MTLKEAYIYVFATLDSYYEDHPSDELNDFVSNMNLWGPVAHEQPGDPAFWHYWIDAVRKASTKVSIVNIDNIEALFACANMLRKWDENGLRTVIQVVEEKANRLVKVREDNRLRALEWQRRQSEQPRQSKL